MGVEPDLLPVEVGDQQLRAASLQLPADAEFRRALAVIARMTLRNYELFAAGYHGTDRYGSVCDLVLLSAAIYVGQEDGRPMTAAKLAGAVGMPRATVVRKLRQMELSGLVVMDGRVATLSDEWVMNPKGAAAIRKVVGNIRTAADALSKMDTEPIAHPHDEN